ncbi:hypothetical protein [Lutibaculum baratangense]|uniref:Uncharacterized protein n=1 Tax=Lutibaculum baratangense AMV1 TaxID=631454 RepID=V4RIY9_9HYPH|nr:hypothetical protein [Lutibaculum baratangense]ESR25289.1 hypothetical protein N177_1806 [Lutibaculum baratangense AMV1]
MEPTAATGLIALMQAQITKAHEKLTTRRPSQMSLSENLDLRKTVSRSLGDGIGRNLDRRV